MISKELNTKWNKGELTTSKYIRAIKNTLLPKKMEMQ